MKKNLTQTIVLLVALVLGIAWYFVYEERIRPENEKADLNKKNLIPWKSEDILSVSISRAADTIELRRASSTADWMLASPVEDATDRAAADAVVNALASTRYEDEITKLESGKEEGVLKSYGLDKPQLRVTVGAGSDKIKTLLVGNETQLKDGNYIQYEGVPTVFRVGASLASSLQKSVKDLRNKDIVAWHREDIQQLELSGPKGELVLKKTEAGWTLPRISTPADETEVRRLISAVFDVKAKDFASESTQNLGKFGLAKPQFRIELRNKDSKSLTLLVGNVGPKAYAMTSQKKVIYEIDGAKFGTAISAPSAFEDKSLVKFNRFDVSKIVLTKTGGKPLELSKKDGEWSISGEPAATADKAKVDKLLSFLADAKGDAFGKPSDRPKVAALKIQAFQKTGDAVSESPAADLTLSAPSGGFFWASRTGLEKPIRLKAADWARLNLEKKDFLPEPAKEPAEGDKAEIGEKKKSS